MQPPPEAGSALRRLVAHGGIYTLTRIASQGAAFFLLPVYTHALGPKGLGVVEITNAARSLLMIVLLQGLHSAWFRLRYEYEEGPELRRFESSLVWYLLASNVALIGLVSAFGASTWNALAPGVPYYPFGILTISAAACSVFGSLIERKLQAQQRPWAFAVFTLLRTVGTLLTIVFFVVGLHRGALGKVEAEVLAGVAGAISAWLILKPGPPSSVSRPLIRRSLAYGLPLVPHGIAGIVNDMIDRFMINAMIGIGAAGVYALGYRIASVSLLVVNAANQALAPLFIEGMRAADREPDAKVAAQKRTDLAQLGLLMVASGACLVQLVTAIGPDAIRIMATREFSGSIQVLIPVGAGVVAWVFYAVFSQSLTYDGSGVRTLPWISATAASCNVLANLYFIPRWNVVGAAWATFLSNSVMALLGMWLGMRHAPLPYAWSRFSALIALSAVGFVLLALIESQLASWPMRVAAKLVWLAVVCAVALALSPLRWRRAPE